MSEKIKVNKENNSNQIQDNKISNQKTEIQQNEKNGNFQAQLEPHHHHLKQEWKIYSMTLNACLGSWFFGYNICVYNGAQRVIQELNGWNEEQYQYYSSLITAFTPLGALIGCLVSKQIVQYLNGIRKAMIIIDIISIIGTLIMIFDHTLINLLIGRIICGFAVGINTAIVPIYVKDFSPVEISGKAGGIMQVCVNLGVLCSYMVSFMVPLPSDLKDQEYDNQINWRIMLGLPIIACIIRLVILSFIYKLDTPSYMMKQHRYEEVVQYLQQVYEKEEWKEVFQDLQEKVDIQEKEELKHNKSIFSQKEQQIAVNQKQVMVSGQLNSPNKIKQNNTLASVQQFQSRILQNQEFHQKTEQQLYKEKLYELANDKTSNKRFLTGMIIQFSSQLTGSSAIYFYSSEIFNDVSNSEMIARICTVLLGVNATFITLVGVKIIGLVGRRTYMLGGLFAVSLNMFILAFLQGLESTYEINILGIVIVFIYIQCWELTIGTVSWIYNSEILDIRRITFCVFIRWSLTTLIGFIFPYMKENIKLLGCFLLFGAFGTFFFIILFFLMKETAYKDNQKIVQSFCSPEEWKKLQNQAEFYAKEAFQHQHDNVLVSQQA